MKHQDLKNLIKNIRERENRPAFIMHRALTGNRGSDAVKELETALNSDEIDGIEVDLQATADNHLLVRHDFAIRFGMSNKWLKELNLNEVREKLSERDCLTLDKFAQMMKKTDKIVDLEIKQPGLAKKIIKICQHYGIYDRVYFTTIYEDILKEIQEADPGVACMYGYPADKGKNVSRSRLLLPLIKLVVLWIRLRIISISDNLVKKTGTYFMSYYHKVVTPELVKHLHEKGILSSAATVYLRERADDDQGIKDIVKLLKTDIDLIKVDHPHLLTEALAIARE